MRNSIPKSSFWEYNRHIDTGMRQARIERAKAVREFWVWLKKGI